VKTSRTGRSLIGLLGMALTLAVSAADSPSFEEPLFDWKRILEDPLEAKVLKSSEAEGIVVEQIEYASQVKDGNTERVGGILAYPKGGTKLPAVFWSQPGMYDAGEHFPKVFAKKGYICLNITLPHAWRNSFAPFDVKNPKMGNLTRLAIDQLRAITYLAQRPETDPDRIGIGGSSYGGFFATLIAARIPGSRRASASSGQGTRSSAPTCRSSTGWRIPTRRRCGSARSIPAGG